jgi:hypothetical protein
MRTPVCSGVTCGHSTPSRTEAVGDGGGHSRGVRTLVFSVTASSRPETRVSSEQHWEVGIVGWAPDLPPSLSAAEERRFIVVIFLVIISSCWS